MKKKKNRLIRSYAGKLTKAYTSDSLETTLSIVEVPLLDDMDLDEEDLDDNDIEQGKNLLFQCDCCQRSIELVLDENQNIIGARCPDCEKHDINAS